MQSIGKQSVFRAIQHEIRNYILRNGLKPGDMLPPAAEMVSGLDVSSASYREALRALEALAIVETISGVGTRVRAHNLDPILENLSFSLVLDLEDVFHLLQVREAMESGLIGEVVERIGEDDLATLEELLEAMQDGATFRSEDHEFHRTLYRCLKNPVIAQFIDIFWTVFNTLDPLAALPPVPSDVRHHQHAPILMALRARDVGAAREGIRKHFEVTRSQVAAQRELREPG